MPYAVFLVAATLLLQGTAAPPPPQTIVGPNGQTMVIPGNFQGGNQPQTGTGSIHGRVALDDGRPIVGAEVRLLFGAPNNAVESDENGRFQFDNLPAGNFVVQVLKAGLFGSNPGMSGPGGPASVQLRLADGQSAETNITMRRGGVIAGRIIDGISEPMAGVQVMLMRMMYQGIGQPRMVPAVQSTGPNTTNDLGEFRIFGIPPGTYYLSATYRRMGMSIGNASRLTYPTTFFPGTTSLADAQTITVGAGELRDGFVMMMTPVKGASISGVLVDADGQPITGGRIGVTAMPSDGVVPMGATFGGPAKPDGTFQISGVPPGSYTLRAMLPPPGPPPGPQPQGYRPVTLTASVTVNGDDVAGVRVAPPRTVRLSGRVVPDATSARDIRFDTLRVSVVPARFDLPISVQPPQPVNPDGTFEMEVPAVPVTLQVRSPVVMVKAILVGGRNVLDAPIDVNDGVSGIEIDVTTHGPRAELIVTNGGQPAPPRVSILMFPQDRALWRTASSSFVSVVFGAPPGRGFPERTLPPGKYFAIAVDAIDMSSWRDPAVLERLSKQARSVELHDGDALTIELPLVAWKD